MGMGAGSWYGTSDEAESLATIHAAIERGVNLLDTGDFYGMGRNELLINRAIAGRRDKVLLSVKFGAQRGPDGANLGYDASPAATKSALAYTLVRLRVDHIRGYLPARAPRSEGADRGDGRGDRGSRQGGVCPAHRAVGGRAIRN